MRKVIVETGRGRVRKERSKAAEASILETGVR